MLNPNPQILGNAVASYQNNGEDQALRDVFFDIGYYGYDLDFIIIQYKVAIIEAIVRRSINAAKTLVAVH